jgi:hypothetical protein
MTQMVKLNGLKYFVSYSKIRMEGIATLEGLECFGSITSIKTEAGTEILDLLKEYDQYSLKQIEKELIKEN